MVERLGEAKGSREECTVVRSHEVEVNSASAANRNKKVERSWPVIQRKQRRMDTRREKRRNRARCAERAFWLKFSIGLSLLCTVAAQICGNGILDPPFEECDDNNLNSNDGCSSLCIVESIAYMTWYNSHNCTGKVLKQQIFNDREYLVSKDFRAALRWGVCCVRFAVIVMLARRCKTKRSYSLPWRPC
jgi:cysteine-rich repeat protein